MFKKFPFVLLLLIAFHGLSASLPLDEKGWEILKSKSKDQIENALWSNIHYGDYPYNPHVNLEVWDALKPYFIPFNSQARIFLDLIFQTERVTLNRESLAAAGFELRPPKLPGNVSVGSHPLFKGYLFKIYLDDQDACESHNFLQRITGAKSIARCIKKHGFQDHFKVPKKWVYPLPLEPSPPNGDQYHRKSFILIAEDMNILGHHENGKSFKTRITRQLLEELYTIVTEEGLIDSIFSGNIPFNADGQINFIDTEHHHRWPIDYNRLRRYLSPEMDAYWEHLATFGFTPAQ